VARPEFKNLRNEKGVALMLAIFTVVIITYLVTELSYETNVEYIVNASAVHRLKAAYAARSGLELSLLRIKLYSKVQRQFGKQLGSQAKLLDMIWSFPFAWPLVLPNESSDIDKATIKDVLKESQMDASYFTSISDEGSKIDINDLGSQSKKIAEITKKNLTNVFDEKNKEEDFRRTHPGFRTEELIENLTDWVDLDSLSKIRGNEADYYSKLNSGDVQYPPNRGFRTVEELRFVAGVDDEIFNILKDRVTVFGMKAINPNHANPEVLMSLDPSITKEVAQEAIKRRDNEELGGPFKDGDDNCKSDFWGFINSKGGRVTKETQDDLPLQCGKVTNFKIRSVGEFNGVTREITAVVYDLKISAQVVADAIKKESADQEQPQSPSAPTSGTTSSGPKTGPPPEPLPKGPPRIVYYSER
jgi:general secretion pathway protein K